MSGISINKVATSGLTLLAVYVLWAVATRESPLTDAVWEEEAVFLLLPVSWMLLFFVSASHLFGEITRRKRTTRTKILGWLSLLGFAYLSFSFYALYFLLG